MKLRLSEQQLHQQVRYFGYYQLLTGLLMLGYIILLASVGGQLLNLYTLYFASLGLACFIAYCGYLTLKRPRRGLYLSRYHLAAQFIGFAAGGIAFRFFAGPFIAISLNLTNDMLLQADAGLGEFLLRLGSGDAALLSINLVAMLLFMRTTQWLNEWNYRYASSANSASSAPAAAHESHN